jgi:two-component system cell cycle sensor histidine kinase/response regulator CckA
MGYTDQALQRLPAGHPSHEALKEVKTAAQRSIDLARQLLTFARKQVIAPRVLDLNDTIGRRKSRRHLPEGRNPRRCRPATRARRS